MFKKTLLALALSSVAATAAAKTTVEKDVQVLSAQGIPATKLVTLFGTGSLDLTIADADNSAFVEDAKLILEISGGFFQNSGISATHVPATGGGTAATVTPVSGESTSTKVVFNITGGAADYDVTDGTGDDVIQLSDIDVLASTNAVSIKASLATASGVVLSTTTSDVTKIAELKDQWVAAVSTDADPAVTNEKSGKLDAKIDVGNKRLTFESKGTSDKLTFDIHEQGQVSKATVTNVVAKIKGKFDGVKSVSSSTGGSALDWTINEAKTEASATFTSSTTPTAAAVADATTEVTLNLYSGTDKEVAALAERDFTLDLDVNYTNTESAKGSSELLASAAAGSWKLNSETFTTNYMPFGPNTAPIIQATSDFSEDAALTVMYLNPTTGKYVTLEDVATVKANSVTVLGATIAEAVLADFGSDKLKTKLQLSVNAPSNMVEMFFAFKDTSDNDRLGVK